LQQPFSLSVAIPRNLRRIETAKRGAIAGAFVKDDFPTKACLSAFEDEKLEEFAIVVHRHTPFGVVISDR
jgi:hypothetical protein